MTQSLAERLEAARRQQFVGRSREQRLLQDVLVAADSSIVLIYIYGPGGVGKTSLLRETSYMARQVGAAVHWLDGRNLEPSPTGFLTGLQHSLALSGPERIMAALAAYDGLVLLLIDTAELLAPLDSWLRDVFLPQLPENVMVVMAGRNPPSIRWRTDPGWQRVMQLLPLENLSQEESRMFLRRRQIPKGQDEAILDFTKGHPLALSLVADVFDQQPETDFRPEDAPDIIKTLLEQFLEETPTANHRAALEASSQVRMLTEPLLGAMLKLDDPYPIFEWLRGLSFMEAERRGLYPHDLAREAVAADLRWRDPLRQADLHNLARAFYMRRFQESDAQTQQRILADYIFLHRENPIIRTYFDWQTTGTIFTDNYKEVDEVTLLAMVRNHEGETAESIAAHWLARHPQEVVVVRQADGTPMGFLLQLSLEKCSLEERSLDQAVVTTWEYLTQNAPLREGETATLFRFWMAGESYQRTSAVQSRIFVNIVQHFLTKPGLAFSFLPCAEPDFWQDVLQFADQQRLPEADFAIGERTFGVFGHDWRTVPPLLWLANMAKKELEIQLETAVEEAYMSPLPILDEAAFSAAVRDALRDFGNEVALQNNPLRQSRQIISAVGVEASAAEQIGYLRELFIEAAQTMRNHPKQTRWYRALYHTYIQPAATQEKAAELLDLPFSTYRRHLRAAIQYVTEWLWTREI